MKQIHQIFPIVAMLLLTAQPFVRAQSILRGPYLQSQGPNSIILRWRTDSLTDSRVYFGDTLGATASYRDSLTPTTEHRVLINGLQPLTRYYYQIGTTTQILRGPDSLLFFQTAPDTSSHVPVRFWAIGDFGHGNQGQAEVRESYLRFAQRSKPADLQLWLGDNAYSDGTDLEFQQKVFDTVYGYAKLMTYLPFASTSGNHDYNSICPWQDPNGIPVLCNRNPRTHTGPYLDLIDPPTRGELGGVPSGLKLFYSMDYGDVHLVFLNSELGSYNNAYNWTGVLNNSSSFTSPMLDWLKQDLQQTNRKWKVVIWHQTPYSGQDNFTEENSVQIFCTATRHHFNPIIEQYGADLVLTGHDHNFQRSYLINGHYGGKTDFTPSMMINGSSGKDDLGEAYVKYMNGPLAGKGTVYVLAGNSSEGNAYSPMDHPALYYMHTCDTCYGSFVFDVEGDELKGYYLTSKDSIFDYFTIRKQWWTGTESEEAAKAQTKLYPTPFHDQIHLDLVLNEAAEVSTALLDLNGKTLITQTHGHYAGGKTSLTMDLRKLELNPGMYLLKLTVNGKSDYFKTIH